MTDEEIRAVDSARPRRARPRACRQAPVLPASAGHHGHRSHVRLPMVVPTAPGSPCVIEPAVTCNQCGYCVSMGH